MRICITVLCLAVNLSIPAIGLAASDENSPWDVPTFECLGLYYPSVTDQGDCDVQYRRADEKSWREAVPLVYDSRNQQYRGSLVGLKPDTDYTSALPAIRRLSSSPGVPVASSFPSARRPYLPAGELDEPVRITEPGNGRRMAPCDTGAGEQDRDRRVQPPRQLRRGGG